MSDIVEALRAALAVAASSESNAYKVGYMAATIEEVMALLEGKAP